MGVGGRQAQPGCHHQRLLAFLVQRLSSSRHGCSQTQDGPWEAGLTCRCLLEFRSTWLLVTFTELLSLDLLMNGGFVFSEARDTQADCPTCTTGLKFTQPFPSLSVFLSAPSLSSFQPLPVWGISLFSKQFCNFFSVHKGELLCNKPAGTWPWSLQGLCSGLGPAGKDPVTYCRVT